MQFCGITERFGEGAQTYRLSNQRPKFHVRSCPPQFTVSQFTDACMEAFGRWSAVCDVIFTPTADPNSAQFMIFTNRFDGPSGILADCMFPSPGLRQQDMRIDPTERWVASDNVPSGSINLFAVLCHEMGHGLGIAHLPSSPPPDLMEPTYSSDVNRPQSTEVLMVQKLYGQPQIAPPSTPVPPLGDSLGLELIISQANQISLKYTRGSQKYQARGTANPA